MPKDALRGYKGIMGCPRNKCLTSMHIIFPSYSFSSYQAFLGNIITRAGVHLPGNLDYAGDSFDSFPNGWAAINGPDSIPGGATIQIILFVGFLELAVMKDITGTAEFPGDFRNGALDFGWDSFSEETKLQKRAIELNNGRAAQMGILGLMVHEQLGGSLPLVGDM